ncbi:Cytochrome b561 domain-containing protein [Actinidia chinensis var. chinensis]|uniref:Cytochrome b561 domain-containing protein n=1 Tax=Actinidia chinensis var. chinensis TaxID=1590841 RepID=A0A2R6QT24_ACTCC|nr:Cytochrome b561 domain-containing protein [Actinidia chinensis var. chinensis]
MQAMQRLVSFTIPTSIVIVILLPFISSSQEHEKTYKSHTSSNKHSIHTYNHKLHFEIILHGLLLWASMGFLMPIGILIIRMSNTAQCRRRLKIMFYIHASLQLLSLLLATAGAIMSLKHFENSFNNVHQRMGLTLYGAIWLQAVIGFLRPHRGSRGRSVWFFVHWLMGTAVSILGIINVYTGLHSYHKKTSRSIKFWTMIFTGEISFIAFLYLFQDKWDYILKQGVVLGNEPVQPTTDKEISPPDKQKDSSIESC